MNPTNKTARLAGLVYLSLVVVAPFSLLYVPNHLIVRGDAVATAANLRAHETMFRLGIVAELASAVIVVFLTLILYRLFNNVDRMQAALLVIFGSAVSVPVTFVGVAANLMALIAARGGTFLQAFSGPQADALAMLSLRMHGQCMVVNEIFWGMWLFPFGILIIRSGFIPKIFGVLLLINGVAYIAASLSTILLPTYSGAINNWMFIPETGELWIMLWLIIKGVKVER